MIPTWVSNERKYERAIAELKSKNLEVTEEAIKALYIRYGGLVLEKSNPVGPSVELEDMKVAELRALAAERKIDVDGLKKDEIIEALRDA